jgi:hypothetical protein
LLTAALPLFVFDVNETLLDLTTLEATFERIFGDEGVVAVDWQAALINRQRRLGSRPAAADRRCGLGRRRRSIDAMQQPVASEAKRTWANREAIKLLVENPLPKSSTRSRGGR